MDDVNDLLRSARDHHRSGRLKEAEAAYRQILGTQPDTPEVHHLLGLALAAQSRRKEAIDHINRALALRPNYPEAAYNLAKVLQEDGQLAPAAQAYRDAIALRPTFAPAYNNLGIVLQATHDLVSAEAAFRYAIRLQPELPESHYNVGNVLKELNRLDDAVAAYQQALALKPDYPDALVNLGNVVQRLGHIDQALTLFRRALAIQPNLAIAHNSLGNALKDAGDLDGAIDAYRRSITAGGGAWAWDNLLYTLHFHPDYTAARICEEHRAWNLSRPSSNPYLYLHLHDRSPDRLLKVAYISPDFRTHPVGRFMLPLLAHHDHNQYRIFCYSDVVHPDALTESLRTHAAVWRDSHRLSDLELVDQLRSDDIDILVDLTMHMDGNRLPVFAQRPAPVQVTYLAYCSTTGLEAIDYRLTDPHLDPPGIDESVYSEKTFRLPRTYWCYDPPGNAPDVAALPALRNGYVTFGCLNNYSKVTVPTWEMWVRILREVPDSRLIVQCPQGIHRELPKRRMAAAGLDPDRLTFVARIPFADYLALYNTIDIALDPFPYGGGTTTLDALHMGVPVVTRAGDTAVSRGGSGILHNFGYPNWISMDASQYVRTAEGLAADLPALARLRSSQRQKLMDSPLTHAPAFARDVEAAFRRMWIDRGGA